MAERIQDYRKYLLPTVLAGIKGLELRARMIVEGFVGGMHHSPRRGLSIEFADHRAYAQGDDIRHIDWKVYAKTDKHYIKEYEQETNQSIMLVVDTSESMSFQGSASPLSKFDYATSLAAATSYLALKQHDAVGLITFDDDIRTSIKPSSHRNQWKTIVRELAGEVGGAKTATGTVFGQLADRLNHRMLIVVISDLFDDPDATIRGLQKLRFRHHDLIVWNLWDDVERSFPLRGPTMFEGLESTGSMLADPEALRASYVAQVDRFQAKLSRACGRMQIDFERFSTLQPLDTALTAYLATRSSRLRRRSARVMGSR